MMRDIWFEILEDFAQHPAGLGELRVTNPRRDNQTTAEFRAGRREAMTGRCTCGAEFTLRALAAGGTRCPLCQILHLKRLRAARDRGRKR
jgi:hypothetical protein